MLHVGQIIDVEVRSVAVFGLFCAWEGQEILVLIPETSWIASCNSCLQLADPGDHLAVKVVHVDSETGKVSASIRAAHPDPWRNGLLAAGLEHQARVVRYVDKADRCEGNPGYLIELLPGAYAMLRADGLSFRKNQSCVVRVCKSDESKHAVEVIFKESNN
jgi:predicted RNA-binding protein with RPS1 domain